MKVSPHMDTTTNTQVSSRPIRYIAITGSTAKSCSRLKSLLKETSYYCLVDCYKNSNELAMKEAFYLPDLVIIEIRSLYSLFSVNKKIETLRGSFPGIKLVLYYNMMKRFPLLELRNREYPELHSTDNAQRQVQGLNIVLKGQ